MPSINNYPRLKCPVTVTIASAAQTSSEADLGGLSLLAIRFPAAFTGTTVTFTGSTSSGGTFQTLYDNTGTLITYTVAQGKDTICNPAHFAAYEYIKVVSGSSEGAARTVTLLCGPL